MGDALAACYSRAEFDAEQAIRLHTELMVIGLSCHRYFPQQRVFDRYQEFTTRHRALLMEWEKELVAHFRKNERGNPTRLFDAFRTEVANEISQRAALLSVPVYCTNQIRVVDTASAMSGEEFKRFANQSGGLRLGSRPLCQPAVADLGAARR